MAKKKIKQLSAKTLNAVSGGARGSAVGAGLRGVSRAVAQGDFRGAVVPVAPSASCAKITPPCASAWLEAPSHAHRPPGPPPVAPHESLCGTRGQPLRGCRFWLTAARAP